MESINNVMRLQVNIGTSDFYAVAGTTIDNLPVNRTGAFSLSGLSVVWDNTDKRFEDGSGNEVKTVRFITREADGKLFISDDIVWSSTSLAKHSAYSAAVEQLDYVGYNGTAESIEVIDDNVYQVDITMYSTQSQFGCRYGNPEIKYGVYQTSATSANNSQYKIAEGLVSSLVANFSREPEDLMKFEVLTEEANAGVITGTGTLTVTNGDKYVAAATDALAVVVVGDYLRFGTATTDPVYRIVSIDGTNDVIELATPYQGASGTVADSATGYIAGASIIATTAAGVKMEGMPQYFEALVFHYEKSRWDAQLTNMGATVLTKSVAADEGIGTPEQVIELERELEGTDVLGGIRVGIPPINYPTYTDMTLTYDMCYLQHFDQSTTATIGHDAKSYKQIAVAINSAATTTIFEQIFA